MSLEKYKHLLAELERMEIYRPSKHRQPFEQGVSTFSNFTLGLGLFLFAILTGLAAYQKWWDELGVGVVNFAVGIGIASILLTLLSLLSPLVLFVWYCRRWKSITYRDLEKAFEHDFDIVESLKQFPVETLSYTKLWLETRVSRFERRMSFFFGSKTAAFSLLFLSLNLVDRVGGFEVLTRTIGHKINAANFGDWLAVWTLAFVLGLSLAALVMRGLTAKYIHQAEIVGLALEARGEHA
ncbi:hypothetical protein [Chromohalobacter moromii]|uniref:Uncharacterized protein n=1 Tax=Chromohalobacter moromii TaxID=2860329 RepID=A0A9X2WYZ9_9GAMM|nr:hypothetical protein [Chromohalobacter moromii]MCK2044828.1 hypothetical protein [Chromohalobacter moromii]MCT8504019.1 hypothetical protein [Chromohalobacter moromii]